MGNILKVIQPISAFFYTKLINTLHRPQRFLVVYLVSHFTASRSNRCLVLFLSFPIVFWGTCGLIRLPNSPTNSEEAYSIGISQLIGPKKVSSRRPIGFQTSYWGSIYVRPIGRRSSSTSSCLRAYIGWVSRLPQYLKSSLN